MSSVKEHTVATIRGSISLPKNVLLLLLVHVESGTKCSSLSCKPSNYLRENEALLVGEDDAALLGHVIEQPRSVLQAGQVQHLDGFLAFHEGESVEFFVRGHVVLDGLQVLPGAFDVPLLEGAPLGESQVELRVAVRIKGTFSSITAFGSRPCCFVLFCSGGINIGIYRHVR